MVQGHPLGGGPADDQLDLVDSIMDGEEENDHGCVQEAEGAAVRDLPLRSAPKTSHAVLNDRKIVLIDGKTRSGHGDLSPPAGTRVPCTSCHLFALAGAWARKKGYSKGVYVTWCLLHAWHGLHHILYAISPRSAHVCKFFVAMRASN